MERSRLPDCCVGRGFNFLYCRRPALLPLIGNWFVGPDFQPRFFRSLRLQRILMNLLLALPLLVLFVILGGGHITTHLVELPVVMTVQFVLMLSLAYLLATANVAFRDMEHIAASCCSCVLAHSCFLSRQQGPGQIPRDLRTQPDASHHRRLSRRCCCLDNRQIMWRWVLLRFFAVALLVFSYKLFSHRCDRFVEEL